MAREVRRLNALIAQESEKEIQAKPLKAIKKAKSFDSIQTAMLHAKREAAVLELASLKAHWPVIRSSARPVKAFAKPVVIFEPEQVLDDEDDYIAMILLSL